VPGRGVRLQPRSTNRVVGEVNAPMKTALITGKGRSGTTWVAQILNTYVHCAYKHEPFLPGKRNAYLAIREQLGRVDPFRLRKEYERVVRSAVHGVDQPPFPASKSVRPQNPSVLRALYVLGNKAPRLRMLFETYARPHMHEDADVLIKDVNFPNELLPKLCDVIQPWLLPVVRNPFANIASHLQGVKLGQFQPVTDRDRERVRELLGQSDEPTLRGYRDALDKLTPLQFETVRWRLQVEPLLAFAQQYRRAHVIVYEDLCARPMQETERVFEFLGWNMKESTREFIRASTSGAKSSLGDSDAYYSVYRDPTESLHKWRDQLSAAQQNEIASVFRDSPHARLWNDLPLERVRVSA
jgi:hypothetical protein